MCSFHCFIIILVVVLLFASGMTRTASAVTLASDVAALVAFKSSIVAWSINPWSCLASWNFSSDPCRPVVPSHFTCGISCTSSASSYRVAAITLDPAGYSGTLSPAVSKLTALSHLDLFGNAFHGPLPSSFPASLVSLVLASNSFSGAVPASALAALPSLETLDLSHNALTGAIPAFPSASLASLDLSFNRLSGPLPDTLPASLVQLALRGNSLSGPLRKPTFQRLTRLEVAELAANRFEGKLEGWFLLLPSLQQADLANNSISSLQVWRPGGGGGGQRLVAVDLSFNRIEGELPAELAGFPSLAALSARHNRLRGQIPWQYGSSGLRRLFLDGNFLNGAVPQGLIKGPAPLAAGSFGDNCLEACPASVAMCTPVQKPGWLCRQVYGAGRRHRGGRPSALPSRN